MSFPKFSFQIGPAKAPASSSPSGNASAKPSEFSGNRRAKAALESYLSPSDLDDRSEDASSKRNQSNRHPSVKDSSTSRRQKDDRQHSSSDRHSSDRKSKRFIRDESPDRRREREKRRKREDNVVQLKREAESAARQKAFLQESAKYFQFDRHAAVEQLQDLCLNACQVPRYRRATRRVLGLPPSIIIDTDRNKKEKGMSLALRGSLKPDQRRRFFAKRAIAEDAKQFVARRRPTSVVSRVRSALMSDFIAFPASDGSSESDEESGPANANSTPAKLDIVHDARTQKVKEFNAALMEKPQDVDLWLQFISFQAKDLQLAQSRSRLVERQLQLYERALVQIPDNLLILRPYLQLGAGEAWDAQTARIQYRDALQRLPHAHELRLDYLTFRQGKGGGADSVLTAYAECIDDLHLHLRRVASGVDCSILTKMRMNLVHIFARALRVLVDAGFHERAAALVQAQIETTFFRPDQFRQAPWEKTLDALQGFWNSEVARIGDPGALGWARSLAAQSFRGRNNVVVTVAPTVDEAIQESDAEPFDAFGQWSVRERFLERHALLPLRVTDSILDPVGIVFWEDVEPYVVNIDFSSDVAAGRALLYVSMSHWGINLAPFPFMNDPAFCFPAREEEVSRIFDESKNDARVPATGLYNEYCDDEWQVVAEQERAQRAMRGFADFDLDDVPSDKQIRAHIYRLLGQLLIVVPEIVAFHVVACERDIPTKDHMEDDDEFDGWLEMARAMFSSDRNIILTAIRSMAQDAKHRPVILRRSIALIQRGIECDWENDLDEAKPKNLVFWSSMLPSLNEGLDTSVSSQGVVEARKVLLQLLADTKETVMPSHMHAVLAVSPAMVLGQLDLFVAGRPSSSTLDSMIISAEGTHGSPWLQQVICIGHARLLALHASHCRVHRPRDIRKAWDLAHAVSAASGDATWECEARTLVGRRARAMFARRAVSAAGSKQVVQPAVAARLLVLAAVTQLRGGTWAHGGPIRAALTAAIDRSPQIVAAWRLLEGLEARLALAATTPDANATVQPRDREAAQLRWKASAFRAVQACPWSKSPVMAAVADAVSLARVMPTINSGTPPPVRADEILQLWLAMEERGLRVRVPLSLDEDAQHRMDVSARFGLGVERKNNDSVTVGEEELDREVDALLENALLSR